MTPEQLIGALIETLQSVEMALNRSVLDGTISCEICRCLVLDGAQSASHYDWHRQNGEFHDVDHPTGYPTCSLGHPTREDGTHIRRKDAPIPYE